MYVYRNVIITTVTEVGIHFFESVKKNFKQLILKTIMLLNLIPSAPKVYWFFMGCVQYVPTNALALKKKRYRKTGSAIAH
jgi:hypothetical protein